MRRAAPLLAAVCAFAVPRVATATPVERCIADAERGQLVRDEGKLVQARKLFLACASESCPSAVRADCQTFVTQIEPRVPSVVFVVKDANDVDLVDVRVSMDGARLLDKLGTAAVEVEPGSHVFRFERAGYAPVETTTVLREFEKGRPVRAVLGAGLQAGPSESSRWTTSDPGIPTLTWVFGGVAVAGGIGFAALWLSGKSEESDKEGTCAPFCAASDVSSIKTKLTLADVSLGVGGAAAIAAFVFYVTRPTGRPAPSSTSGALLRPTLSRLAVDF